MNCQGFADVVSDLARQQTMEASTREEAIAHSNDCEECARKLADERRLTLGLRALAAEMNFVAVPDRIEEQLLGAFRMQRSSPRFDKRGGWRYVGAVAAAVLLIVFGVAGIRWRQSSPSGDPPITTIVKTTGPETPSRRSSGVSEGSTESLPSNRSTADSHRRKSVRFGGRTTNKSLHQNRNRLAASGKPAAAPGNSNQTDEVSTQFMPLGYLSPVSLQEGGQVVRVEFPRSAMASLGLPVNMERYGERVKADVLVGADGLARAIRFVQ